MFSLCVQADQCVSLCWDPAMDSYTPPLGGPETLKRTKVGAEKWIDDGNNADISYSTDLGLSAKLTFNLF